MAFPVERPRRLRRDERTRALVRETRLTGDDLIQPLFIRSGEGVREEISSMPGQFRFSPDTLVDEARELRRRGVPGILLFGIPPAKDARGTGAYASDGVVPQAIRRVKEAVPDLAVLADVCLCEYTDHGHCGLLDEGGHVANDPTLDLLARTALAYARAGADWVAPSDMMDGRVAAIRRALDEEGLSETAILSYSVKYASAFYGPFREAAGSTPRFGDRRGYQMDPANVREAMREARLDAEEGADAILVKPALPYLDVVAKLRDQLDVPVAAYDVSGSYSMLEAAARQGFLDRKACVLEALTSIKRAGAAFILTYWARQASEWL